MKPPVEAPASRQRRPSTPARARRSRQRPGQLVAAAGDVVGPVAGPRATTIATSVVTCGRRLGGAPPATVTRPAATSSRGVLAGAGQPAADQLGVEPESSWHAAGPWRQAGCRGLAGVGQRGSAAGQRPTRRPRRALHRRPRRAPPAGRGPRRPPGPPSTQRRPVGQARRGRRLGARLVDVVTTLPRLHGGGACQATVLRARASGGASPSALAGLPALVEVAPRRRRHGLPPGVGAAAPLDREPAVLDAGRQPSWCHAPSLRRAPDAAGRGRPAPPRRTSVALRASPPRATSRSVTPVITSRLSSPARWAPSMSVSSRSPTTSGRSPPTRRTSRGTAAVPASRRPSGSTCRELRDRPHQHAVARPGPAGSGRSCRCWRRPRAARCGPRSRPR